MSYQPKGEIESAAYSALSDNPNSTAAEIGSIIGRSAHSAISALKRKGFVVVTGKKPNEIKRSTRHVETFVIADVAEASGIEKASISPRQILHTRMLGMIGDYKHVTRLINKANKPKKFKRWHL